jgi:MFS_1 like family
MARTSCLPVMAAIEPLHGLTFALLHLACMRLMSRLVPVRLAARAQAFYGTVAVGAATALLTLLSGPLYQAFGSNAFLVMADPLYRASRRGRHRTLRWQRWRQLRQRARRNRQWPVQD